MDIGEWLKTAVMHPLQERVIGLGLCPKCHTKTLRQGLEAEGVQFCQCERCLIVYVIASDDTPDSGTTHQ